MKNNEDKYNVCFFNTNIDFGGGEKWHIETAEYLSRSGYNITFFTNKQSKYLDTLYSLNFKVIKTELTNLSFLNPLRIISIARILKREKINCVIVNLPSDLKVVGFAARLASLKKIIYRRGSAIPVKRNLLNKFLLLKTVSGIIVNSEETRRTILAGFPELENDEKIVTIYNGLNIPQYDNQSFNKLYVAKDNEIVIGNAGRMVYQKNQSELLLIAKKLADRGLKFKLIIAGDGELEEKLKSLTKELNISEFVRFTGFVNDIKSFMESIDVFALTSHWEGFGYVLTEAMASYKPVVAYDISSNPEIVVNNETGFLVEKGNLEEFANNLEILINSKEKRLVFGNEGRKIVESKFDFNNNIKHLLKLV